MLNIPQSPTEGTLLAAYLAADNSRCPVFDNLIDRLTPDGRVGIIARYYVSRCAHRRAVYRGILLALGEKLPEWAKETPKASAMNRVFVTKYRGMYNAYRVRSRNADR